jgi:hypothetical protein
VRPIILQMFRSRWFAWAMHAALWVVLYLSVVGLNGKRVEFREAPSFSAPSESPAPLARLDLLFAPESRPKTLLNTNETSPFFTRYFIPAQTPVAPPPTTRKIDATYQGFYETADGPKHAIIKLGDAFVDTRIGARIVTNFFVAEATFKSVILTNLAGQTNLLPINTKKEIEVPLP